MNNWQQQRQQHEEPLMGAGTTVTATFRPNLSGFTPTKIRLPSYGSNSNDDSHSASNEHTNNNNDPFLVVRVNATNDFATANYENEVISHWIDVQFLEASLGQQQANRILSQLDAPPCRKLLGTYSGGGCGEQVLGTLPFPLSVSCQFDQEVTLMDAAVAAGVGPRKRHANLLKKQERLQSTRTFSSTDAVDNDDASQRERQVELLAHQQQPQQGINDNSTATGPLSLPPGWVNLVLPKHTVVVVQNLPVPFHISFRAIRLMPNIVPALSPISPSLFPEHYESHTYWTNGLAQQLQELARRHRPDQQQEQKGLPTPPLDVNTCACCCQPNPRVRCGGGCQDVFYCDKICQQGHWKLHKKTCPQQQQASFKTAATTSSSSHSAARNSKKEPNTNGENNINGKKKWWNKS